MHTLSQSKMKDFSKKHHDETRQDVTAQSQDVRFATLPSGKVATGEKNGKRMLTCTANPSLTINHAMTWSIRI